MIGDDTCNRIINRAERYKTYLKAKYTQKRMKDIRKAKLWPADDPRWNVLEEKMKTMPHLTEDEKDSYREEYMKTMILAAKDLEKRLSVKDFISMAIIGRGAFGEVRLVRRKESNDKRIYGQKIHVFRISLFSVWFIFCGLMEHVNRCGFKANNCIFCINDVCRVWLGGWRIHGLTVQP